MATSSALVSKATNQAPPANSTEQMDLLATPSDLDLDLDLGGRRSATACATSWPTCSRSTSRLKNYHWHLSGRHLRDYHLLLDE